MKNIFAKNTYLVKNNNKSFGKRLFKGKNLNGHNLCLLKPTEPPEPKEVEEPKEPNKMYYPPYRPPPVGPYQQQPPVPASNFAPSPVTPPNSFAPMAPTNYFNPALPVQNPVPPTIPYNQASHGQIFYGMGNFYFFLVFVCVHTIGFIHFDHF